MANILPGLRIDEFLTRTDVAAGVTNNFLTDALGSPVAVTDNAGTVQTEYTYEPFGQTTVAGVADSNPYQYTGRENDGTGLYYYRARYYHPQLQRFISEDPLPGYRMAPQSLGRYSYVWNNPQSYVDPSVKALGLLGEGIAGGIAGGILGYMEGGWQGALYGGAVGFGTGLLGYHWEEELSAAWWEAFREKC